ncbi:hypothetical protein BGW39_003484, partial [Mortierella sp. 14UC]
MGPQYQQRKRALCGIKHGWLKLGLRQTRMMTVNINNLSVQKAIEAIERMEMVEMFRHFSKKTDTNVTSNNFGEFMDMPIKRQSIAQWNKDFNKIKFDVAHGRGDKRALSRNPDDLIRHILDKTVFEWLREVRKNNGVVSGLQLQASAGSVLHILLDDILAFDDIPTGRTISFTAAWRSRMTREYSIAYCNLKGEAGSVDKDAIAGRMDELRNICSDYEPDDIYNCDETG